MYYTEYEKIEYFKKYLIGKNLDLFDWRELKKNLLLADKDNSDQTMLWYYIQGHKNKTTFESNTNSQTIMDEDNAANGSEYLHVDLTGQTVDSFKDIQTQALSIPGMMYAGIHFLGPGSVVDTHTDPDVNNFLFYLKSNDQCIFRVGNNDRTFETGDLFMFDGETPHSAYNCSDKDWIIFALRISKQHFKKEKL